MPKSCGASVGYALGVCLFLVNGCASSSDSGARGAAGMSGASGGAVDPGGASGSGDSGGREPSAASGTAGEGATDPSESGSAGAASGAAGAPATTDDWGDLTPGTNIYIAEIVTTQVEGGGPPKCLPRPIQTGLPGSPNDGRTPCMIVELRPGACDCSQPARAPVPDLLVTQAKQQLQELGECGGTSGVACDAVCGCAIPQAPGLASDPSSELHACQNDLTPAEGVSGFCEIDRLRTDANGAPAPLGSADLVSQCPSNQTRLLRFVGGADPVSDGHAFLACTNPPTPP
jgi:hypothetical protein